MTAIRQLKRRTSDSNQVLLKLSQTLSELEKYLKQRIGTTESLPDQERSHTIPAHEMNDSMSRVYIINEDFNNKQRELGKEWARKYNPHYKQR